MQLLLDPVVPLVERNGLFQQLLVKRSHVDMEILLPFLLSFMLWTVWIRQQVPKGRKQSTGLGRETREE